MEKTILVVDDEKDWVHMVGLRLTREGYQIETSYDAVQAVGRAVQIKPQLILLDIMMPGGGGLVALKNIRGTPKGFGVPVIVVSARGDAESKDAAAALGISGYFVKPVNMTKLITRVGQVLRD